MTQSPYKQIIQNIPISRLLLGALLIIILITVGIALTIGAVVIMVITSLILKWKHVLKQRHEEESETPTARNKIIDAEYIIIKDNESENK